jgi:hypothetical protein
MGGGSAPSYRGAAWLGCSHVTSAPAAARLGLSVTEGSRETPEGERVSWKLCGVEQAAAKPCLPFFIQWASGSFLPGETKIDHPAGSVRFERLDLEGEPDRIFGWIGARNLPITVRPGTRRTLRVVVHGGAGEIIVSSF